MLSLGAKLISSLQKMLPTPWQMTLHITNTLNVTANVAFFSIVSPSCCQRAKMMVGLCLAQLQIVNVNGRISSYILSAELTLLTEHSPPTPVRCNGKSSTKLSLDYLISQ